GTGCLVGVGGPGFGQLDEGRPVTVDCRGGIWVGDTNFDRITRFGEPGTPLPTSCPVPAPPPSGGGAPTPIAATQPAVTQNPLCAALRAKLKKAKSKRAKSKIRKKLRQLGC